MASQAAKACRISAVIFGVVFLLHLWRLITNTEVIFGTWSVPMGISWLALVLSGALAWWMWRASRAS